MNLVLFFKRHQFNMHLFRILAVVVVCLWSVVVHAQTLRQYMSHGDDAMRKGEYYNAAQYYKQGLEKIEFNIELRYKYAEALRSFNDSTNAGQEYKKVRDQDVTKEYPLARFWYGLMLHCQGQYKQALPEFKKFLAMYKKNDYYHDKAQQELESCSWAIDNMKDSTKVIIIHLSNTVNTVSSETNPFEQPDGHFLFSSMRNQAKGKKRPLYRARIYKNDSITADAKVFDISGANMDMNIANGAYCTDGSKLYFTQCRTMDTAPQIICEIYSIDAQDSLATPRKLDDHINIPGYTATQPHVARQTDGTEVLYYVSDRPGGYGKTDIWMSKLNKDGSCQPSVNLGAVINTPDEEFSPFYDQAERKLYFASNWHYGFGGLDIFETTIQNGSLSKPKNLGHSINSPQNDFYFYESIDRSKNYFASNRNGSFFIKSETCCNDIWLYETGKKVIPEKIDTPVSTTTEKKIDTPTRRIVTEIKKDTVSKADTPHRVWIDKTMTKIKQLLPVTLYFHNDEPECCNLRDTTSLSYVETFDEYRKRLSEYKYEYTKSLKAPEKEKAEMDVTDLFTQKVEKGYRQLIQFSAQLLDVLAAGQKIEVTIQGYCSPLHYNQYNIQLGYRRIASLRNYFYHYRDGILMPYLESGKLLLKNESLGEERADKKVSDKLEDTRNSVYNPAAALERKVEIISVELK